MMLHHGRSKSILAHCEHDHPPSGSDKDEPSSETSVLRPPHQPEPEDVQRNEDDEAGQGGEKQVQYNPVGERLSLLDRPLKPFVDKTFIATEVKPRREGTSRHAADEQPGARDLSAIRSSPGKALIVSR
jgi:hypothetical protein